MSTYRPGAPIVGATPSEKTYNRLTMSWGVTPVLVPKRPTSGTELFELSAGAAVKACGCQSGDIISVTAGMPVGKVNYTNTLRVLQLTDEMLARSNKD